MPRIQDLGAVLRRLPRTVPMALAWLFVPYPAGLLLFGLLAGVSTLGRLRSLQSRQ